MLYHSSYTAAVQEITRFGKVYGYTFDDESNSENIGSQMFNTIGMGPKKPDDGVTNSFSFDLYKKDKLQKKKLHAQVYGNGKTYELNMYKLIMR